ncbi:MAG: hypothetical protein GXY16_02460 [Syntrophomonadaceae bacterium]|nr:hypothetical protein [Syntrophomonadaceae bacterium]
MSFSLIYILLLVTGLFLWLEGGSLLKRRNLKELLVVLLILVLSFGYGIDYATNARVLPDPKTLLSVTRPISDYVNTFFQVKD